MMAFKTPGSFSKFRHLTLLDNLSAGELGDSLGTLRDGVLGEFTRQAQSDGGLDLSGTEHTLVVVSDQASSLRSDLLEGISDQGVQDGNGSLGDAHLRVNLLQDSDNVG